MRQGPVVALAAVVLAVLIAQFAVAGGSDGGKIASLQRQINELKAQVGAPAKAAKKKKAKAGPPGPAGPQGPAGSQGQQGIQGPAGPLASGQTKLSIGPQDWVVRTGSLTADYGSGNVAFTHSAGGVLADQFFSLGLDLPTTLQGVPQRFGSIEVCYGNDPNTALDRVMVGLQAATPAAPDPGETFVIDNPGNFVDDNCRTFSPASPVAIGENDYGALTIGVDYSDNGTFVLFRTTVNLVP